MDFLTYRRLLGQIKNGCAVRHYNFPCHNLLSKENLIQVSRDLNSDTPAEGGEFLSSFPCYQRFPYGVQTNFPLFCGSGVVDHARELVFKKRSWELKLKKLKITNIDTAIRHVKKLKQNKRVKVSEDLKKYISHFNDDPEPMFSGGYNWLYSGGCLSCYDSPCGIVLISADCVERRSGFYWLKLNESLNGVEQKHFYPLKVNLPVLEIKCKGHQDNVIICVRQKNFLSLFSTQKENPFGEMLKLWRKKVSKPKLLTSVDLKDDCEEVVLTDTKHDIHVFHVEKKNKVSSYSGKKIASREFFWSQVAFGENTLYWATKGCFAILDKRDLAAGPKLKYSPTVLGEKCEQISSFVRSSCDSNFVYLTGTHSAFQIDLRNGKTVQKWTHMMKSPPQFLTSVKDEESELLVLQSQTVGETSGIVNEWLLNGENVNFISRSLPCLLRSMKDSLEVAQLQGLCLNPFLGKRVIFGVTGMQCLRNNRGEIVLLTKNSAGDVFLNRLKKTGVEDPEEVREKMKNYENHFECLPPEGGVNTQMNYVNMTPLSEGCLKGNVKESETPMYRWQYEEMYALESLNYYKDVLAKKILKVWAPEEEEEEEEEGDMSVDQKVREWMEKC